MCIVRGVQCLVHTVACVTIGVAYVTLTTALASVEIFHALEWLYDAALILRGQTLVLIVHVVDEESLLYIEAPQAHQFVARVGIV